MRASSSGPVLCATGRRSGRWACPHPHSQPGIRRHRPEGIPPCGSARRSGGSLRRTDREPFARDARHGSTPPPPGGSCPRRRGGTGWDDSPICGDPRRPLRTRPGGIVWQKANRSVEHPLSRFDLAGECGVWRGPGGIEGRIIPREREFPGDLRLEQGKGLGSCPWAMGKNAAYALGSASMSRLAAGGIIAGVVGQDVGRLRPFGFGTIPIPEDRSERGRQLATHGTQGFEPGTEQEGIDRSKPAPPCRPPTPSRRHPGM